MVLFHAWLQIVMVIGRSNQEPLEANKFLSCSLVFPSTENNKIRQLAEQFPTEL
jgi:hypothetical protein